MSSHRIRFVAAALVIAFAMSFAPAASAAVFVVPEVIEDQAATDTFDTWFKFVYTAGLAGIPKTPGSATVTLYLFDHSGAALQGQTGAICFPCNFVLNASNREERRSVQQLANQNAGGLLGVGPRRQTIGFAIIGTSGNNLDSVVIDAFLTNVHSNGYDLATMGLAVRELLVAP